MTILVVGDSNSFGLELGDLPQREAGVFGGEYTDPGTGQRRGMQPSGRAWPALVAQTLGHDLVNLSVVGAGNSRVHRVAMAESVCRRYDLVICVWTELARLETAYLGQECPITPGNPKWPWVKNVFADHFSLELEYERFLTLAATLESWFRSQGQAYIYTRATGPIWRPGGSVEPDWSGHVPERIAALEALPDLGHRIFWQEPQDAWCHRQGVQFGPGGHFLEAGHRLIAEHMVQFIHSLGYK